MDSVDEVSMDANKFVNYLRQYQKQQQAKQDYQRKRVRMLWKINFCSTHTYQPDLHVCVCNWVSVYKEIFHGLFLHGKYVIAFQ